MISLGNRTKWLIWIVLLLLYLFMAGYVMNDVSATISQSARNAECAVPLDLHILGFTYPEAYKALECMGNESRAVYRLAEVREDIFYPICYVTFFTFTIFSLSSYLLKNYSLVFGLVLISLSILLFDFLENYYIVSLIDGFPKMDEDIAAKASLFNEAKWSAAFFTLGMIGLLSILSLIKMLRKKGKRR